MHLNLLRDPSEQPILAVTVLAILILLVLMAGLSLCLLPLGIILFVVIAYFFKQKPSRRPHRQSHTGHRSIGAEPGKTGSRKRAET